MKIACVTLCLLGYILCVPIGEIPSFYYGPEEFNEDFPEENPGLFEGDIVLRPGEDPMNRNSITNKGKLWPRGVLPYVISSAYSSYDEVSIRNGMKTIEDKTRINGKNCITFTPHNGERQYIRFVSGSGCHTPVGLGYSSSSVTLGRGCLRIGTIMHEISHALGMWHEQSRHDRDNYVTIDFSNIISGRSHNFNKYQLGYIDELGEPYDYESVMHYGAYSFAKDRRRPTIIPKQRGVTIGQRTHLSPIDIKEIQILYGCIPRPTSTGLTTLAPSVTAGTGTTGSTCTFEHGACGWKNEAGMLTWAIREGKTPSIGTGPTGDHSGFPLGHYLYVEASGHYDRSAFLTSQVYSAGHYCLEFYFDMYGHAMGYLKVHARVGNKRQLIHEVDGNQGNRWVRYRVNINVPTGSFAIELEGHVGTSFTSDIAIDDLTLHTGKC